MVVQTPGWERRLLSLAQGAGQSPVRVQDTASADSALLSRAYQACRSLTAQHSRSFYLASAFLPSAKRQAVHALYAYCRVSDNIVDEPGAEPLSSLQAWREIALTPGASGNDLVALAWADTRQRFRIPTLYAEQLIDGVALDLQPVRYPTFDDLAEYCYRVASTVGLMSMHIIGFTDPRATRYAIKMGVALQLTNILRDVGEDWAAGRMYLPTDELDAFGLTEADIGKRSLNGRWRRFLRYQIQRAEALYREAWPGIFMLERDGRLAVAAAAELYRGILRDIAEHGYNVFTRRAHVSTGRKLMRLPAIWLRSRRAVGSSRSS